MSLYYKDFSLYEDYVCVTFNKVISHIEPFDSFNFENTKYSVLKKLKGEKGNILIYKRHTKLYTIQILSLNLSFDEIVLLMRRQHFFKV